MPSRSRLLPLLPLLLLSIQCLQLKLTSAQTCLDYSVSSANSTKLFYFHYNHNYDSINLILYHQNIKQIWHETGSGIDFRSTLQVTYPQAGIYTLCFIKKSQPVADVQLQIVDEADARQFVGKEQLARVSRRISEFLMDIKRVGLSYREIIDAHNKRREAVMEYQDRHGLWLVGKVLVMAVAVGVQVLVVKKIIK